MSDFWDPNYDWPELVALIFLIIGFSLAVLARTYLVAYIVVFLLGLFLGRTWYRIHGIPLVMATFAVVLGFVLGVFLANLQLVVLLYLMGIVLGYWVHRLGWIRSAEF